MHDYIVEPLSRLNIRQIVKAFRKFLGIKYESYVDVTTLLDVLSKKFKGFSYQVVANNFDQDRNILGIFRYKKMSNH